MTILVTGGSSLLGKYLHANELTNTDVHYTWYSNHQPWTAHQMDVCDRSQVLYVFGKVKPDIIIHMAAVGSVDYAECNYREAWNVNVEGTRNVLDAARDHGARVLLTSTNAVFSGGAPPYAEDAPRMPVNAYGKIRREAERLVMQEEHYQIVRLFLLYGWEPVGARGNWASSAVKKLQLGRRMKIVSDRWYMPTYAEDAADAVWTLLGQGQGVYHVAGADRVTLHQFVLSVAETWQLDPSLVEPIPFGKLSIAPRPVDTAYDLSKCDALGIQCRGPKRGLLGMMQEKLDEARVARATATQWDENGD